MLLGLPFGEEGQRFEDLGAMGKNPYDQICFERGQPTRPGRLSNPQ
jgi:hypothetical protein